MLKAVFAFLRSVKHTLTVLFKQNNQIHLKDLPLLLWRREKTKWNSALSIRIDGSRSARMQLGSIKHMRSSKKFFNVVILSISDALGVKKRLVKYQTKHF